MRVPPDMGSPRWCAICDQLMPMHAVLSAAGVVVHGGPTLQKLVEGQLEGRRFLDVFAVRRPQDAASVEALIAAPNGRVQLELRDAPHTALRGQALRLRGGFVIVNLSFGIAVAEAVAHHALTATDFSPTDLTVEMLYLIEAKRAVMRESRELNARLQKARETAETQALSDVLTSLGNRRAMDAALSRLLARDEGFGLLHVDLDYFKAVNDSFGHAAGDHVLEAVSDILRAVVRVEDFVARVGGDEFVVLVRGVTDRKSLVGLGERLIAELEKPIRWHDLTCRISGSVGITATSAYLVADADRMLSDADEALYAAKRAGRGRVSVTSAMPG